MQLRTPAVILHVPGPGVMSPTSSQANPSGSMSVTVTFFQGTGDAARLLTLMVKIASFPASTVPPSGVLSIFGSAGLHVHFPTSFAGGALSATTVTLLSSVTGVVMGQLRGNCLIVGVTARTTTVSNWPGFKLLKLHVSFCPGAGLIEQVPPRLGPV